VPVAAGEGAFVRTEPVGNLYRAGWQVGEGIRYLSPAKVSHDIALWDLDAA